MYEAKQVVLEGKAPLILHNGRLADSLDPFTKELKRLTSKRKKTDEDSAVLASVEWCGGMYHTDGNIEIADGIVAWDPKIRAMLPASLVKACIVEGAKKSRLGKHVKAGVLVVEDAPIVYKGPADLNKLMQDPKFVLRKAVAVQRNKVMRTRPMFREWSVTVPIEFDPEVVNWEQVIQALIDAGRYVGIGDWRPEHGRFELKI